MDAAAIFSNANGSQDPSQVADQLIQQAATSMAASNPTIPTFGGVSLQKSKDELARAKASRENFSRVQEASQAQLQAATDASKRAADASALAEGDEAKANQARAQAEADNYSYFNNLFGINQGGRIADQAKQLSALQDEASARLADIKERQGVGFLDNPLEWLYNQVDLPSSIDTYNRTAQQVDMVQSNITTEIAEASTAGAANAKGIPTITTAQAKAQVDKAAAIAQKTKATLDSQMAKENVDFANRRLAADLSVLSATQNMTQMEFANASAAYHSQITAITMAQTFDERKLKAAELLDKLAERKSLDPILARADEMLGNAPGTTTRAGFLRLTKASQENIVGIGAGSFGANPFEAFLNIRAAGGIGTNATPAIQDMYKFIQNQMVILQNDPVIGKETDMKKKQELIADRINQAVFADLKKAGQPTSIFHELSPKAMFGAGIIQPDSPIGKILEPMSQGPAAPDTPTIISAFLQASNGDPNQAGQAIASYYKQNMQLRNKVMSSKSFGIQMPTNYPVQGPGTLGLRTYDLSNPAEATKYVIATNVQNIVALRGTGPESEDEQTQRPAGVLKQSIIPPEKNPNLRIYQ